MLQKVWKIISFSPSRLYTTFFVNTSIRSRRVMVSVAHTNEVIVANKKICDSIQQKVHLVYFWFFLLIFALSNRWFNKLSNNTKFVKIEEILSEIHHLQSLYFLLFSLYFALYSVHYLRINLADKMYLLLYWVTYLQAYLFIFIQNPKSIVIQVTFLFSTK